MAGAGRLPGVHRTDPLAPDPEDMRGRYMAVSGFSYGIPYAVGPLFAGLILDNADPRVLWWAAGFIGIMAVTMFLWLHGKLQAKPAEVKEKVGV